MEELCGRTILVTGGSGGIGATLSVAFAAAGARVAVHAHSSIDRAEATVAEIDAAGGAAMAVAADVSDPDQVEEMIATVGEFGGGKIEGLVNCAGAYPVTPFDELTPAIWRQVLAANLDGPFYCALAALPWLRAADRARVLHVGSGTVDLGTPGLAPYIAAKSGLVGLTRAMARDLGADDIGVNCLVPSLVETETADRTFGEVWDITVAAQAVGRRQQPADLVDAALFLCSPRAEWITGQTVHVDGGLVMR
ncbi:MAG: SDR family oxidoreductase [Solirubrobacterales bacterium]